MTESTPTPKEDSKAPEAVEPAVTAPVNAAEVTEKLGWGRYLHSFFVVPLLIAGVGVLLGALVLLITRGPQQNTVGSCLKEIKEGRHNERWQAAESLGRLLSGTNLIAAGSSSEDELIALFQNDELYKEDPRVRQFLGLAMGRSGNAAFLEPLSEALSATEEIEEKKFFISGLGLLRDERAMDQLHPYLKDPDASVRLQTVISLGNIASEKSLEMLKAMLHDPEPNVSWDAAIALAKSKDPAGRDVLLKLLNREYYEHFENVRPEGRAQAMKVAIHAGVLLDDQELNSRIKALAENDPNVDVKSAALAAVKHYKL